MPSKKSNEEQTESLGNTPEVSKNISARIRKQNRHNNRQRLWNAVYQTMAQRKSTEAAPEVYADKAVEQFNKRFSDD